MIIAVEYHAGQGNDQREHGDGYSADPTEPLAEFFAGILGALRETVRARPLNAASSRDAGLAKAPLGRCRWFEEAWRDFPSRRVTITVSGGVVSC
jgi:hypothetical protein